MSARQDTARIDKRLRWEHAYYLRNKHIILRKSQEYYLRNKDKVLQRLRNQRERDRIPRSIRDKRRRAEHRIILFTLLGRKCIMCGYNTNTLALQFDHINGGGRQEWRDRWGSHEKMIKYYAHHLEDAKQRLQVLCANCNTIKALTTSY